MGEAVNCLAGEESSAILKTDYQKRKEYRIANGQCVRCGRITRDLDPKNHLCLKCFDKRVEAYLNWLEKQPPEKLMELKERRNRLDRERHAMRKANHQCTKCGVDLDPADPRTYCEKCREKDNFRCRRDYSLERRRLKYERAKAKKALEPKLPKLPKLPKVVEPPREPSPEELRIKENAERMRAEKRRVEALDKRLAYIRMMDNMAAEAEHRRRELEEARQERLNNLAKYVSALRR